MKTFRRIITSCLTIATVLLLANSTLSQGNANSEHVASSVDEKISKLTMRLDEIESKQTQLSVENANLQSQTSKITGLQKVQNDTTTRLYDLEKLQDSVERLAKAIDQKSGWQMSDVIAIFSQIIAILAICATGFWSRASLAQSKASVKKTLDQAKDALQKTLTQQEQALKQTLENEARSLEKTLKHSELSLDESLKPARSQLWLQAFLEFTGRYARIIEKMPQEIKDHNSKYKIDWGKKQPADAEIRTVLRELFFLYWTEFRSRQEHGKALIDDWTWGRWMISLHEYFKVPAVSTYWNQRKQEADIDPNFVKEIEKHLSELDTKERQRRKTTGSGQHS